MNEKDIERINKSREKLLASYSKMLESGLIVCGRESFNKGAALFCAVNCSITFLVACLKSDGFVAAVSAIAVAVTIGWFWMSKKAETRYRAELLKDCTEVVGGVMDSATRIVDEVSTHIEHMEGKLKQPGADDKPN